MISKKSVIILILIIICSNFVLARVPSECSNKGGVCKSNCGDYEIQISYSCKFGPVSAIEYPTGMIIGNSICCIPLQTANKKDLSMFQEKQIFLISD